ncbi:hypothetical protein GH714_032717 [Hevea brasiliensis]|uniref:Leucine-rich repeat-containing N-terminal plant-type domain-containing protein n=1 Tax=Hevea brasiliensis TaxID=3981 RepID=A0A6A6L364_HEVBR|nr:hypothetical protein GH714_032717 [Hevea brasiliensis]
MLLLLHFLLVAVAAAATPSLSQTTTYLLQPDAVSLLSFKSKADLDNKLLYTLNERFDYCEWQGVKCVQGRVVRFVLQGSFPPSILLLHRLNVLDLSYNNLTGHIPVQLSALDRLSSLRLERNHFNGSLPPLNQSFLIFFNVSGNNLTGPIPVTSTLSKFDTSSFSLNPDLCGEIINKACTRTRSPFFDSPSSSNATSPTATLGQSAQAEGGVGVVVLSPPSTQKHKRTTAILGFAVGVSVLIVSLLCIFLFCSRNRANKQIRRKNSWRQQRLQPRLRIRFIQTRQGTLKLLENMAKQ